MRRAPHDGQKPRRLQLNATSLSCPQSPQCSVNLGTKPCPRLLAKITKLVQLHRESILDFRRVENGERSRFRSASVHLRGALLALHEVTSRSGSSALEDAYCAVAAAAQVVQEALNSLVVSRWHVRTPRLVTDVALRDVIPPIGPSGVPALGNLLNWLKEQLTDGLADFETAAEILRENVPSRWHEDPFEALAEEGGSASACSADDVGHSENSKYDAQSVHLRDGLFAP